MHAAFVSQEEHHVAGQALRVWSAKGVRDGRNPARRLQPVSCFGCNLRALGA
jgi:hypothetical protein